jgi:hypothetical protein
MAARLARRERIALGFAGAAIPLGVGACASLFGVDDPPGIDPCAASPCVDVSLDATRDAPAIDVGPAPDASDVGDALQDADASVVSPELVVCGGNGYPLSICLDATPACCETVLSSTTDYSCVPTADACAAGGGYPVLCNSNDDCLPSDNPEAGAKACCHFKSNMVCAPVSHCIPSRTGVLVCDPDAGDAGDASGCPSGTTCTRFSSSAYFGCQ